PRSRPGRSPARRRRARRSSARSARPRPGTAWLRLDRADDRGVHAVPGLLGRGDGDAREPGPGQPAAVLGKGRRPGDAAGPGAALEPFGRGEVALGEDVGDAQAAVGPQYAEAL